MDLAAWRDIALIIIGILYGLVTLVVGAVAFFIWLYSRKGFGALEDLLNKKVRPALDAAERQLMLVRDRSAALPGNLSLGAGELPPPRKGGGLSLPVPFRRKKKRRLPFLPS
jgi:hypothetical protein